MPPNQSAAHPRREGQGGSGAHHDPDEADADLDDAGHGREEKVGQQRDHENVVQREVLHWACARCKGGQRLVRQAGGASVQRRAREKKTRHALSGLKMAGLSMMKQLLHTEFIVLSMVVSRSDTHRKSASRQNRMPNTN